MVSTVTAEFEIVMSPPHRVGGEIILHHRPGIGLVETGTRTDGERRRIDCSLKRGPRRDHPRKVNRRAAGQDKGNEAQREGDRDAASVTLAEDRCRRPTLTQTSGEATETQTGHGRFPQWVDLEQVIPSSIALYADFVTLLPARG
jgi:hypothetical protein